MSARKRIVDITSGIPHPVDGLCPNCMLPSLYTLDVFNVSEAGVSVLATLRACSDCGERFGPDVG